MNDPQRLLERCAEAVDRALALGAQQAEVFASAEREAKVNLEADDIGSAISHDEERFGIRVRLGGATGFAGTNDGSPEALEEAAQAALALARVTPPTPEDELPEPRSASPVDGLFDPALEALDVERLGKHCGELAERARKLDARVRIDSGWVGTSTLSAAIASSTGVRQAERSTSADALLFGMAVDGDRVGSFDAEFANVCALGELDRELESLAPRFVRKLITSLDAGPGESFRGTLVLSRDAVAEFLLPPLVGSLSAQAVRMGRSRFAERIGESVASPSFGLLDDGTLAGRPGSASFDREGLPHRPLSLIEAGVLRSFLYNTREAQAASRADGSTGHATGGAGTPPALGPTNLIVAAGELEDEALVAEVDRGVLLSRYSGNTDPVSGDFSGVAKGSFLLRRGHPPRPIQETLISGNLYELLQSVSGVGRARHWVNGTVWTPMVRLEGVSVTAG